MKINWRGFFDRYKDGPTQESGTSIPKSNSTSAGSRSDNSQAGSVKRKLSTVVIVTASLFTALVFGAGTYFLLNRTVDNAATFSNADRAQIIAPNQEASAAVAASLPPGAATVAKPVSQTAQVTTPHSGDTASLDIKTQNPFKAEFLKKINSSRGEALPAAKLPLAQLPPPPMVQPLPPPPKKLPVLTVYGIASFNGQKCAFTSAGKILEKDKIGDAEIVEIKENGILFDAGFLPLSKSSSIVIGKR